MANDEVLGPRKTMFVLVIVVGCFAVLWPRILSPLILGHTREQLKPNQFDREAGCCEVIFEPDVAILELVNEVCSSAIGQQSAAECRKAVNETCGVDIAGLIKQKENVGKTTKMLVEAMKNNVKQERPPIRAGPHPALRERGRAIPPGTPPPSKPIALPPHVRVRSPLSVYYELDIKPPPIPGMRPPLGSPGGPVAAPKSSMGFVMPIYTICIIVFFVYTLSKILFKRTGTPYEPMAPDPQFRRRVFRDDSRTTPDKFGHKETETIVSAISGLVAEVQQQMETSYVQNQQRQEALDSTRPYTNGSIILNSGPVQIVTNEYQEPKENTPEPIKVKEPSPEIEKFIAETINTVEKETEIEHHEVSIVPNSITKEDLEEKEISYDKADINSELVKADIDYELIKADINSELVKEDIDSELIKEENIEDIVESKEETNDNTEYVSPVSLVNEEVNVPENTEIKENEENEIKDIKNKSDARLSEEFIHEERKMLDKTEEPIQEFTHEIVEETIKEDSPVEEEKIEDEKESSSVKVVGMELTADGSEWPRVQAQPSTPPQRPHEAEEVKAIYLETEIPQQSRVLIADFAEDRAESPVPAKNAPLVVSGKITLSLIQNAPRETPDRDVESTVDDFTTASGFTQPAEKQDDLSDEDIEEVEEIEEIEVEEIEEEVEEEEIEEVVENEEE